MQAQLQELESKILASMAEMQGRSAREAAASLGQTLQKEGVVGVTEEVRGNLLAKALSSLDAVEWAASRCQLSACSRTKVMEPPGWRCGWMFWA